MPGWVYIALFLIIVASIIGVILYFKMGFNSDTSELKKKVKLEEEKRDKLKKNYDKSINKIDSKIEESKENIAGIKDDIKDSLGKVDSVVNGDVDMSGLSDIGSDVHES